MGLFDFFKIKAKPKFDIATETDIKVIIDNGIAFEDTNQFLPWGSPAESLRKTVGGKKRIFADRTVYNWGERDILKGLKLELSTVFWYHKESSAGGLFTSVEFLVADNKNAVKYQNIIKLHIENLFGKANANNITETEAEYVWIIIDTRIYLHFYQQYTIDKLYFEISRL